MKRFRAILVAGIILVPSAALADEPDTWAEFREELVSVRQQIRTAEVALGNEWREDECRYQSLRSGTWTELEERLTARCALSKWPATSWETLDRILECESHWIRTARNFNPGELNDYLGLGQHHEGSWPGRVRAYEPAYWEAELRPRWQNSRTMLVVTVRMMAAQGLSPWSCA